MTRCCNGVRFWNLFSKQLCFRVCRGVSSYPNISLKSVSSIQFSLISFTESLGYQFCNLWTKKTLCALVVSHSIWVYDSLELPRSSFHKNVTLFVILAKIHKYLLSQNSFPSKLRTFLVTFIALRVCNTISLWRLQHIFVLHWLHLSGISWATKHQSNEVLPLHNKVKVKLQSNVLREEASKQRLFQCFSFLPTMIQLMWIVWFKVAKLSHVVSITPKFSALKVIFEGKECFESETVLSASMTTWKLLPFLFSNPTCPDQPRVLASCHFFLWAVWWFYCFLLKIYPCLFKNEDGNM